VRRHQSATFSLPDEQVSLMLIDFLGEVLRGTYPKESQAEAEGLLVSLIQDTTWEKTTDRRLQSSLVGDAMDALTRLTQANPDLGRTLVSSNSHSKIQRHLLDGYSNGLYWRGMSDQAIQRAILMVQ